jgi:hypothetical protein
MRAGPGKSSEIDGSAQYAATVTPSIVAAVAFCIWWL